jgi:hypothetical protein
MANGAHPKSEPRQSVPKPSGERKGEHSAAPPKQGEERPKTSSQS